MCGKRTLRTLELTMLLNILKVVNYIAERGVKLASDFLTSAEIEKKISECSFKWLKMKDFGCQIKEN